jgi:hypothetical protein
MSRAGLRHCCMSFMEFFNISTPGLSLATPEDVRIAYLTNFAWLCIQSGQIAQSLNHYRRHADNCHYLLPQSSSIRAISQGPPVSPNVLLAPSLHPLEVTKSRYKNGTLAGPVSKQADTATPFLFCTTVDPDLHTFMILLLLDQFIPSITSKTLRSTSLVPGLYARPSSLLTSPASRP